MKKFNFDCEFWEGARPCSFQKKEVTKNCENCIYYNPIFGNVLLIEAVGLGSILRTSVVSKEIKRQHPNFRVQWLTHEKGADLLQYIPSVDRVLVPTPETIYALEGQRFNSVINFESLPVYLALAAKLNSDEKYGFVMSDIGNLNLANNEAANLLEWQTDDYYRRKLNTKPVQRLLLEACGFEWNEQSYEVVTKLNNDERARNLIKQSINGFSENNTKIVGLNIGSALKHNAKRWQPINYYELAKKTSIDSSIDSVEFLILAGPEEETAYEEIEKIHKDMGLKNVHLLGREQSIGEFLSLIKYCNIVVSADTFGMHAAIALNKKVISLHGPQPQQEILFYNNGNKVNLNLECVPCFAGQYKDCKNKMGVKCMTDISVGQVGDVLLNELRSLN